MIQNNNKKIRVLVVGGAGYIGGAVTDVLIKKKIPFSVYDVLVYEHQYLKPVDFIYGDIRDRRKLKSILPSYTHIIWLAALVGDATCQIDAALTREINTGTIKWLVNNFSGRILFASTCSVYGRNDDILNESSMTNPLSLYAITKLDAEASLSKHPDTLIYRIGTAYGVSDHYSRVRLDLAVNILSFNAVNHGSLTYFGGTQWRPFIHVRDIATAFVNGLENKTKGVYNIMTENLQIKDLVAKVGEVAKCRIKATKNPYEDERNYHVSAEKAVRVGILKGMRYNLEYGIKEMSELASISRVSAEELDVHYNERHLAVLLSSKKKLWGK